MRVAGYARTSTKKQDLESQVRELARWAKRNRYKLRVFSDSSISGRKSDRRGVAEMMASAERKEFDLAAVTELSRFGRSIGFIHQTVARLSELGVKVVLIGTNTTVDYKTLEGAALVGALALAADIEWRLIQERNARGRETIRARGVKVGRKRKEVSESALLALRDQGMSVRQIGQELGVSAATISRRLSSCRSAPPQPSAQRRATPSRRG